MTKNPYSNNCPDAPLIDHSQIKTPPAPVPQETVNPWATPPRPEQPAMGTIIPNPDAVEPTVWPSVASDLPDGTPITWGDSTVGYALDGKVHAEGMAAKLIREGVLTKVVDGSLV